MPRKFGAGRSTWRPKTLRVDAVEVASKLAAERLQAIARALEPARQRGCHGRVLRAVMAEVILHRPEIGALVGKIIAAAWRVSYAWRFDTKSQQIVFAGSKVALDGAQLVAGNGLLAGQVSA